jgi:hypothetical protein
MIITNERVFHLQADSEKAKHQWIDVLSKSIILWNKQQQKEPTPKKIHLASAPNAVVSGR